MRSIIIFVFLTVVGSVSAQSGDVYDTAKRMDPVSTDLITLQRSFRFSGHEDSSMLYMHQYNFVKKNNVAIQDLGDVATPYVNAMFMPNTITGVLSGFNPYGENYYYNRDAKFYQAHLPYTSFHYVQGKAGQFGRGMINFDATHTQNIGERFNLAINFHSTTNEGFYQRNGTTMKNLQFTDYYRSKNKRYLAAMIITWNKTSFNENGGIYQSGKNDSLFRNTTSKLRFVPVELVSARNVNRYRDYQLSQTYWLKGRFSKDSLRTFTPQLGIAYHINFNKQSNYYTDKPADFNSHLYDSVFLFNANYSADSVAISSTAHTFEIFTPLNESGVSFSAGAKYEANSLFQRADVQNYHLNTTHNASLFGQMNFSFFRVFQSELKGNYFISGYNMNDYLLHWKNTTWLSRKKGLKVMVNVLSNAFQPAFRQQIMISNHYQWENNFKQQLQQSLSAGIAGNARKPGRYDAVYYTRPMESYHLKMNYTLLSNYIYYGYDAKPAQLTTSESVLQFYGMKHLSLRKFQVHEELVYQVFSKDLKSKICLPAWLSKTSLYFQTYAFKKATFLQVGVDVNYTSDYQARFYNPATRNFQLSNNRVGHYPFADFFINAEIKTAKLFLKVEHFNQDMMSTSAFPNYFYTSPYQPSSLRRVRLGFIWKFYY